MFRYVALIWDDTQDLQRLAAGRLAQGLESAASWQCALRITGLRVFVTGAGTGGNGVYELPRGQGLILGRLFRRQESGESRIAPGPLRREDGDRLLQHEGRALITDWWGRYVAFQSRNEGEETVILRDPTGTLPCFRLEHDGVRIVFSWLEDLIALPGLVVPPIAWERLAAHMRLGELGNRQTVLEGIERVLPGELLHLRRAGTHSEMLWDALGFARNVHEDDPARLAPLLRATVRYCARSWAEGQVRILLRLSGGVDSSILASCLKGEFKAAEILCVNYYSTGADTDERRYARLAARRAGLELIECERDDAFRLERVLRVALTPSPATYVGRMAASVRDAELSQQYRAPSLFTGAGGDQLFFELRTWWPAADFVCRHGLGRGTLRAMMDAARLANLSVWRTAGLALRSRLGLRAPGDILPWPLALVSGDAASVEPLDHYQHPLLRQATGLPVGKLNHLRMLLHPIAYYDPYERERAPDVVNPFLSQPLIELCLRLPTYLLTHGGSGRALARRAFATELPPEIVTRRSKGSIDQHLKNVLTHNLPLARELLLEGELVARGLLDRRRVEAALSGRPQAAMVHVTEIHGHIAVEAWLQRWRSAAHATAAA